MPVRRSVQELITDRPIDLGTTPWFQFDRERLQHYLAMSASEFGPGPVADPDEEVDSFAALALFPSMLASIFEITGVTDNRLISIDQCEFVSSIPLGADVCMTAKLLRGKIQAQGHLVYTIGFMWQVKGEYQPAVVGEVTGLAGNPGR